MAELSPASLQTPATPSSVEAAPTVSPQSPTTPENSQILSGKEVIVDAPGVVSEKLSNDQIDKIVGPPPPLNQLGRLATANTPSSVEGMSLLEQNRADFRIEKTKTAQERRREEQRINAELKNEGVLSSHKAQEKYAAENQQQLPIDAEVEELPAEEANSHETIINAEQPVSQREQASQASKNGTSSGETANQQQEDGSSVPPIDSRLEQLRKNYAELLVESNADRRTISTLRARISELEAKTATQNTPQTAESTTAPSSNVTTPEQTTAAAQQSNTTDKAENTEGENQTATAETSPELTPEQQALVDRINKYVEKLGNMKVRGTTEISNMLPKIRELTTELEKQLDIVRHPERVQQLEAILHIMTGKSITKIKEDQAKNLPDLKLSVINLLTRFTTPEARLDFQKDIPIIQNTIKNYIAGENMTPENIEALRAAIGKTDDELNGSPLGEIIKLIVAALGNEVWDAASSAVTTQRAA